MSNNENVSSVQFTEEMKGYVTFESTNYDNGYEKGKKSDTFVMFRLTLKVANIDEFVASNERRATAEGDIECEHLGGRRHVEQGTVNLLVDTESLRTKRMEYRLFFYDGEGNALTLSGFKRIQDNVGLDVWSDTTTLMINILEGHVTKEEESGAQIVAVGKLKIQPEDFIHQLTTFRSGAASFSARLDALEKFGKAFLGDLWDVYGASFMPSNDPFEREIPLYTTEGVKDAEFSYHPFNTPDKLGLSLLRFQREPCSDVVVIVHGLTTSSDMFIMPEHYNLVQYLLDNGFTDVWTLDYRMSNRYSYNLRRNRFNMDDVALFDFPTALKVIRDQVGRKVRIHFICHCLGSVSFCMSLFGKQLEGVTSVVANSVGLTPRVPGWSGIKLRVAPFLCDYVLGIEYLNPWWRREPGWSLGQLMAWFVSFFHRECRVPACHMLSFIWGTGFPALYSHDNLHDVTHRRGADLYGGVSVNYHRHVRKMVQSNNTAVKYEPNNPKYSSLPDNYFKYAAEIETPILFMTGEINNVFRDSNIVCHERLDKVAPGRHKLHVFPGYGHQDVFMGKNAHRDIFPRLLEHLESHRKQPGSQISVPDGPALL